MNRPPHLRLVTQSEGSFVPSPQQQAVYDFLQHGRGHGLVVARAGTGKTTTIVRALDLLPTGAKVLCCAFNTRIRDVLLERAPKHVRVRTLHQLGRDTMFSYGDYRRFRHDEDDTKLADIAARVLHPTPWREALETKDPIQLHAARADYADLRDAVMTGARLVKATLTAARPDLLALIDEHDLRPSFVKDPNEVAGYIADTVRGCLAAWPLTDFDDEVWLPVYWGIGLASFDYVFIDEAQDLTLTQIRLALSAASENGRIIAIGDPAQAIYRWRGADRDPFARLKTELNAVEFPLSVSYRCPRAVVRLAQASVPDIQAHPDAPEGRVDDIQLGEMLTTVRPGDFVLSRTNAPLAQLGLDLANNNVPMRVLGSADIGTVLANIVKRSKKKNVPTFLEWLDKYAEKEGERLKDKPSALDYLDDKVETIRSFAAGETETVSLVAKIERFYTEQRTDKRTVILSTVHRLKGDEANRVFVLEETFWSKRGDPEEEDHIWYVACTRAKHTLFRVHGLYRKRQDEDV